MPKLAALALLFGGNAWAACAASAIVFSCATGKEKRIEVCEVGDQFEYSYGRPNTPAEIKVRVDKTQASRLSWRGPTRWRFYSMDFPNGKTVYNVYWGAESETAHAAQEGGVNVLAADTVTATVSCNPTKIIQSMKAPTLFVARGQ